MNFTKIVVIAGLLVANFVTAISIVYVSHTQRKLFIDLQKLQADKSKMNIEWDRLLLEENTFSSSAAIKKTAVNKLDLIIPETNQIIFIKNKINY